MPAKSKVESQGSVEPAIDITHANSQGPPHPRKRPDVTVHCTVTPNENTLALYPRSSKPWIDGSGEPTPFMRCARPEAPPPLPARPSPIPKKVNVSEPPADSHPALRRDGMVFDELDFILAIAGNNLRPSMPPPDYVEPVAPHFWKKLQSPATSQPETRRCPYVCNEKYPVRCIDNLPDRHTWKIGDLYFHLPRYAKDTLGTLIFRDITCGSAISGPDAVNIVNTVINVRAHWKLHVQNSGRKGSQKSSSSSSNTQRFMPSIHTKIRHLQYYREIDAVLQTDSSNQSGHPAGLLAYLNIPPLSGRSRKIKASLEIAITSHGLYRAVVLLRKLKASHDRADLLDLDITEQVHFVMTLIRRVSSYMSRGTLTAAQWYEDFRALYEGFSSLTLSLDMTGRTDVLDHLIPYMTNHLDRVVLLHLVGIKAYDLSSFDIDPQPWVKDFVVKLFPEEPESVCTFTIATCAHWGYNRSRTDPPFLNVLRLAFEFKTVVKCLLELQYSFDHVDGLLPTVLSAFNESPPYERVQLVH